MRKKKLRKLRDFPRNIFFPQQFLPIKYYILSGPSFRSSFVFSINSLLLPGFPLTSFNLAEATLSVFLWLYTLVCVVVQKYQQMSFIYNYILFYNSKSLDLGIVTLDSHVSLSFRMCHLSLRGVRKK